jgi:hypothetical protein
VAEQALFPSVDSARRVLTTTLPGDFVKLRTALKPLVGGDLHRVVFVSYGHPALQANGSPCPGGRDGFDVHPSLNADTERLAGVSEFVAREFLPALKAFATCTGGAICKDPATEAMTVVGEHQARFLGHGVCARADTDPTFDRICFSPKGETFQTDNVVAAEHPLVCPMRPSDYRPYASRARWERTADDSYFTAAGGAATARHPRCHLGHRLRGLWRRHPPDRRRPRRHGRRGSAGRARRARTARGERRAIAGVAVILCEARVGQWLSA